MAGRLQRKYLIEPEGLRFTYVFDAAGRTSFVANPQAQRATWSYDAASRVTGIHYANTTRTSYLYDNADRLLRVANLSSTSTTLSSFTYVYDGVGNRKHVVEVTGNRVTWSYDNTYQLKNEQRSGSNSYNITYTYDPVGSRLVLINGGVRTTSTYDAANELTKTQVVAGVTTMTYDANGNLLLSRSPTNQRTSYTWDFENRPTLVALPSAVVDTFVYNGDGQRVQKQDSTGTTKHVWDGQNILMETNGSNVIQVVYTLQPATYGNLISQIRSGTTSFCLFDALGCTRQLVNGTGTSTDSYLYDAFGNILLESGATINCFRYSGQIGYYFDQDLSGYYVRGRYYSATSGGFLSRDPLTGTLDRVNIGIVRISADPVVRLQMIYNRSPYAYARSNPVTLVDPSGYLGVSLPGPPPARPPGFPPKMPPLPPGMPPIEYKPIPPSCACAAGQIAEGSLWDNLLRPLGPTSYPFQHCLWNCLMVAQCGGGPNASRCAEILSWNKEVLDLVMCYLYGGAGDCASAFQPSDFRDNRTGRQQGASCVRQVKTLCPWWMPAYLWRQSCCISACDAVVPRGTPEGPGTPRPYGPLTGGSWPTAGDLQ